MSQVTHPAPVVGIDIGGTKIDIALADGPGAIRRRTRLRTEAHEGPDVVLGRTIAAVHRLLEGEQAAVAAYGVAVAGVVGPTGIRLASNLPGWEDVALAERLGEGLSSDRVVVCNDVRAAALAEVRAGSLRDTTTGLYIGLGTGVAAAVTVGDQVLAGAHGAAGEIGYMPIPWIISEETESRSTLESLVGGRALSEDASHIVGRPMDVSGIVASSDPRLQALWRFALDILGETIAGLSTLVDPARVALGGGLMAVGDPILAAVARSIAGSVPMPPEVVVARFTHDASLHGALLCALDSDLGVGLPPSRQSLTPDRRRSR